MLERQLNIAIMVDTLAVGGAERQAILCVSELRKLGHSVDLIYYRPIREYVEMLERLKINPIYIKANRFPERCHRLHTLFKERRYDVVHGFKMAAEVYAAVAGTWAGVPHRFGSFRSIYHLSFTHCVFHYIVDKFLDGWIVNSKAGADSMTKRTRISPQKIQVLHNGLYNEMFCAPLSAKQAKANLGLAEDSIVVTMIARLQPGKNHRMFIDAAALVLRHVPRAYFLAVGQGPLKSSLEAYAVAQRVSRKVLFLGQRADIAEILAATDISALTTDVEGLPNAIIESMGAGKAIVCTNYAGWDEIMVPEENALISACGDANAFVGNVLRLIRDESFRSRLGSNAAQYARCHFSPEAMAKSLEAIYLRYARNTLTNGNNGRAYEA